MSKRTRIYGAGAVVVSGFIALCIWQWPFAPEAAVRPGKDSEASIPPPQAVSNGQPRTTPNRDAGEPASFTFPFLGEIPLTRRSETIRWEERGEKHQRDFRAYYSRDGVLVRAEYEAANADDSLMPEYDAEKRRRIISQRNHSIVGLPNQPLPLPLGAYLAKAREVASPEKAQRIVVEYVLYSRGETIHPAIVIMLWGGGSSGGFVPGDKIRLVYYLDEDQDGCDMDNGL
jgi:hypothetical protein